MLGKCRLKLSENICSSSPPPPIFIVLVQFRVEKLATGVGRIYVVHKRLIAKQNRLMHCIKTLHYCERSRVTPNYDIYFYSYTEPPASSNDPVIQTHSILPPPDTPAPGTEDFFSVKTTFYIFFYRLSSLFISLISTM
jgi:hypothetical protein